MKKNRLFYLFMLNYDCKYSNPGQNGYDYGKYKSHNENNYGSSICITTRLNINKYTLRLRFLY